MIVKLQAYSLLEIYEAGRSSISLFFDLTERADSFEMITQFRDSFTEDFAQVEDRWIELANDPDELHQWAIRKEIVLGRLEIINDYLASADASYLFTRELVAVCMSFLYSFLVATRQTLVYNEELKMAA